MGQAQRPDRSGARLMQRQRALFEGRAGSNDIIDKQNMTVANFFRRVAYKRAVYIFLSLLAVQFPLRRGMPTAEQSVVFPLHPLRLAPCRKYQFDLIVAPLFPPQRRQRNRDRHPPVKCSPASSASSAIATSQARGAASPRRLSNFSPCNSVRTAPS